jgi:DNA-binding HxlR family transcriptional regulator
MDDRTPLECCPDLRAAFDLLGKRWTALILDVLAARPARFCEIQRAIPGLSDRLLAERLRELVAAGVVGRSGEPAARAAYTLTDRGRRLLPGLDELRGWARAEPAEASHETRGLRGSRGPDSLAG